MIGDGRVGEVVRRLREARELSLRTLAERTGFSPSFLSQVENGQASPSLSSMERIAGALGVTLAQFFLAAERDGTPVVRAGERQGVHSDWSRAHVEALGTTGSRLLPVMMVLEPGGSTGKHGAPAPTEEFAYVLEGSVRLTLGGEEHQLAAGDAATIAQGLERRWSNESAAPARVLVVSMEGEGKP